jgi:trehalose-phosphatase
MTKPLSGSGARAAFRRLVLATSPLLMFDLDGTLAPIVDRPAAARVPIGTRYLLQQLRRTGASVVLVSGRSVEGVRHVARADVDAIVGDHGGRWALKGRPRDWLPVDTRRFNAAAKHLSSLFDGHHGIRVQVKERSIAVHLRLPHEEEQRTARRVIRLMRAEGLRVLYGHRVLDGQMPGVNKGAAVLRWLEREMDHDEILFAGDDTTDEDAFKALRRRAVTIAVGPRPERAEFRTASPATFARWLERLAQARREAAA